MHRKRSQEFIAPCTKHLEQLATLDIFVSTIYLSAQYIDTVLVYSVKDLAPQFSNYFFHNLLEVARICVLKNIKPKFPVDLSPKLMFERFLKGSKIAQGQTKPFWGAQDTNFILSGLIVREFYFDKKCNFWCVNFLIHLSQVFFLITCLKYFWDFTPVCIIQQNMCIHW